MKRLILALALVACAAPLYAHAGGRCAERRAERKAERTAKSSPPALVQPVRAIVAAPVVAASRVFRFFAAPLKCQGPNCPN